MSQELPKNKNKDQEVDLIVFFNLIGDTLSKLFNFINSIFKAVFSIVIHTIKIFIDGWKIILGVIVIAAAVGYALESTRPKFYQSGMLVKPYFDSKYQLVNNIGFFNALIDNKDYEQLNKIFNSDSTYKIDVKNIKGFTIEPGPETENDRVLQYQDFIKKLDTIGRLQADYEIFIENRSIYHGNIFLITAKSDKKDIFKNLTFGINSAFTNEYSTSKKVKDTLLYKIQREKIEKSLDQVEKLQDIYVQVLQNNADNPTAGFKVGELPLTQEKAKTKEFELLTKSLALQDQLSKLDEKRITEDVFVDVISSFQAVGSQKTSLLERYSIIFPILAFLILCLFYLVKRIVIYTNNYEG